jgi:hypothetical protein
VLMIGRIGINDNEGLATQPVKGQWLAMEPLDHGSLCAVFSACLTCETSC